MVLRCSDVFSLLANGSILASNVWAVGDAGADLNDRAPGFRSQNMVGRVKGGRMDAVGAWWAVFRDDERCKGCFLLTSSNGSLK